MKTVIRISTDYNGYGSYEDRNENISNLVNEGMEVHCEVVNNRLINIVEDVKNYQTSKDDFKKVTTVTATGYVQGDLQDYRLYHNEEEGSNDLTLLVEELKKTFTHHNNYLVEKFEREEINGKNFDAEPHDYTTFHIRHIEFPSEEEILEEYLAIYGKDYDDVELCID